MINLSQIARHFSTDNDQKRSICPKLIAALAQAKSPPNHAPRKGIPGGCGNTPCPKSIATPVYTQSHARRASSCTPSKAPAGLREVFCPELVIFPKTGVQIGNTGGFLLPSTSGRGGHKKRWPVPEPLQLFRESLPLPCFPCASFLFKSGLYSPSIAGSASKAAPCLLSRWPFRHAPRCGVERSEYSERESLSWGPARGEVPFSY